MRSEDGPYKQQDDAQELRGLLEELSGGGIGTMLT